MDVVFLALYLLEFVDVLYPREFVFYHSQSYAWFSLFLFQMCRKKLNFTEVEGRHIPSVVIGRFVLQELKKQHARPCQLRAKWLGKEFLFSEGQLCIPYTP